MGLIAAAALTLAAVATANGVAVSGTPAGAAAHR